MPLTRRPAPQTHTSLTQLHNSHQMALRREAQAELDLQAAKATGNGRRIQEAEREVTAAANNCELKRKAEYHEIERLGVAEREKWEKHDRERRRKEEEEKRKIAKSEERRRKWRKFLPCFFS